MLRGWRCLRILHLSLWCGPLPDARRPGRSAFRELEALLAGHYQNQMKFWELVSAFRSERSILEAVFAEQPDHEFSAHFSNFSELVHTQNRAVLDSIVPNELVFLVAARSMQSFSLSENGTLRLARSAMDGQILSALDVVERFGGSVIEEIHERGSARPRG